MRTRALAFYIVGVEPDSASLGFFTPGHYGAVLPCSVASFVAAGRVHNLGFCVVCGVSGVAHAWPAAYRVTLCSWRRSRCSWSPGCGSGSCPTGTGWSADGADCRRRARSSVPVPPHGLAVPDAPAGRHSCEGPRRASLIRMGYPAIMPDTPQPNSKHADGGPLALDLACMHCGYNFAGCPAIRSAVRNVATSRRGRKAVTPLMNCSRRCAPGPWGFTPFWR